MKDRKLYKDILILNKHLRLYNDICISHYFFIVLHFIISSSILYSIPLCTKVRLPSADQCIMTGRTGTVVFYVPLDTLWLYSVSQKILSPEVFWNFVATVENFKAKLYTPIACSNNTLVDLVVILNYLGHSRHSTWLIDTANYKSLFNYL